MVLYYLGESEKFVRNKQRILSQITQIFTDIKKDLDFIKKKLGCIFLFFIN